MIQVYQRIIARQLHGISKTRSVLLYPSVIRQRETNHAVEGLKNHKKWEHHLTSGLC